MDLPHLGRLAPDGSSVLGEIPGHGKVTAILWNTGIPINNDFGVDIEVADGFTVVGAGTSEWPVPIGRSGVDTFPQGHQNAIETLGSRLVAVFYTKDQAEVHNMKDRSYVRCRCSVAVFIAEIGP